MVLFCYLWHKASWIRKHKGGVYLCDECTLFKFILCHSSHCSYPWTRLLVNSFCVVKLVTSCKYWPYTLCHINTLSWLVVQFNTNCISCISSSYLYIVLSALRQVWTKTMNILKQILDTCQKTLQKLSLHYIFIHQTKQSNCKIKGPYISLYWILLGP